MPARRTKHRLGTGKMKNLKSLARKIDTEESASIRARGRAAFARHERLRQIVRELRERRLNMGMGLAEVARQSGIAKPNLSRLENSPRAAPTLDTLERYARAVGMTIQLELSPASAA